MIPRRRTGKKKKKKPKKKKERKKKRDNLFPLVDEDLTGTADGHLTDFPPGGSRSLGV